MKSLWFRSALLADGWAAKVRLSIEGAGIAAIAAGVEPGPDDTVGGVAVPGLPNLHSHAFQRAMAGLAERRGPAGDDFWTWRELMYRFLQRMTPDDCEAVAAQAYAEMLEAGFTRVGEFHYLHHAPDGRRYDDIGEMAGRIAAAAAETGIALTLLPVFYAHGGFGAAPPSEGQRRFICDPDAFAAMMEASRRAVAPLPDARIGIAPHSLRAATLPEIAAILPLAQDGPIHIHAAEQTREVEDSLAATGRRPVQLLLAEMPVDRRWCLIHATHMDADETRALAASGAVAGLCPVTEANLGDGIFPGEDYADAGGTFGIGTDSNILIGAAEEMRALEYAQRLGLRRRNVLSSTDQKSTGRRVFEACLFGGGQALAAPTGLREGGPADIVGLDPDHPALVHRAGDALLDGWIFAARTSPIDRVWRVGEEVVSGGRHVRSEAIRRRYDAALARLLA